MPCMISTKNPFPGMNPFLERRWPTVHARLIGYVADALNKELPADLNSRPEEAITITAGSKWQSYRPDVTVSESWKQGVSPKWTPETDRESGIVLAEPVLVRVVEPLHRWVEIREAGGQLISVIEVLSPGHKTGDGWKDYRRKQHDYLSAGVNMIEVDLLRGGEHVLAFPREELGAAAAAPYMICVRRVTSRESRFVYPIALEQRLPAIAIPLRETDADVPLDLQPLVDRAYENGRHWQEDFSLPLHPPLTAEEQAWAAERLRAAGLME